MRSERPKHLHPLLGRRLLDWSIAPVLPLRPDPLVVVCSPATKGELDGTFPSEQPSPSRRSRRARETRSPPRARPSPGSRATSSFSTALRRF
jgi:hypothetical protein